MTDDEVRAGALATTFMLIALWLVGVTGLVLFGYVVWLMVQVVV